MSKVNVNAFGVVNLKFDRLVKSLKTDGKAIRPRRTKFKARKS